MRIINIGLMLLVASTACRQEGKKQVAEASTTELEAGPVIHNEGKKNYQYLNNGDTISLAIEIDGQKVHGDLTYALKEKDKSTGTLEGLLKDSVLVADYKFSAEGQLSVRQVAFKLLADQAIEGYGEMKEVDGKMIFVDAEKLNYDKTFPLKTIADTTK